MSLHDYHVVCSIHTSEHSVNIRTNSAFGKFRPSHNFRFRTYATLHCLNQIRNFYNFLVTTCFHHNICLHQIHKKFFKISFLALSVTFNKCHFTIIMSCVESTFWKLRKIRLSEKMGLRVIVAVGNRLFFIAWVKFEFFIIFWLRHVFTITFVIIRYTKNFSKYPS